MTLEGVPPSDYQLVDRRELIQTVLTFNPSLTEEVDHGSSSVVSSFCDLRWPRALHAAATLEFPSFSFMQMNQCVCVTK